MVRPVVGVVGGGAWGIALAAAAARTGATTLLLSRRSRSEGLPAGVILARDEAEIGERARLVVLAVPSAVARDVARSLGAHVDGRHFVVHGVRGLVGRLEPGRPASPFDAQRVEEVELETISDIVRDETPVRRVGALGGPALASELLAGSPSVMVGGSHYPEVTRALRDAFGSPSLRLFATSDLRGLEWASALVGCLAIGVGFARGVGVGPGLLAALITRGVEEAGRLAALAGGDERTLLGLAGYGDLLASISQTERPEVRVGEALARGETAAQAVAGVGQRVEAIELIARIAAWAASRGSARFPVFEALCEALGGATGVRQPGEGGQATDGSPVSRVSVALVRELMSDRPS
jgi:glycerol-3-phosphate dehydrogenase (NAD(P)+)